jgi:hypothetical protein
VSAEGWPDAEAVETVELQETRRVKKLTMKLAFRDKAGRDHMTKFDRETARRAPRIGAAMATKPRHERGRHRDAGEQHVDRHTADPAS